MALSEYERRVLRDIELQLRHVRASRWWRLRAALVRHAIAIATGSAAAAVVIALAVLAPGPLAAPSAGAAAAGATYVACLDPRWRRPGARRARHPHRRRRPRWRPRPR